jgi:hypothetical protein
LQEDENIQQSSQQNEESSKLQEEEEEEKIIPAETPKTPMKTQIKPEIAKSVDIKVNEQKNIIATSEIYTTEADETIEEVNIFDDKEIYDIMEIEGDDHDDMYVDETGLNAEEEEGQFILVNYKTSSEDLTSDKYIIEEEEEQEEGVYEEQIDKPQRKKHVRRMPREIVDRYAQSTDSNQHICTKCVKVFSTRTNLIRHIQSHDGNKPYVCNVCNKGKYLSF